MNKRTIYAVIIIGVLSIISILLVQVLWIQRAIKAQKDALTIQQRQDSINDLQFEKNVQIALKEVAFKVSDNKVDEPNLYAAVKEESPYCFVVNVNKSLNSYYLEQVLKRTFYQHNIYENFQYGLYNCFNDSFTYGNLVQFTKDSIFVAVENPPKTIFPNINVKKGGDYFTVFFPAIQSQDNKQLISSRTPWIYIGIVAIVLLIFFAISISVILRQRKNSEIKADFINNMTHELKTPISTIGLSSEMLMQSDFRNDPNRLQQYAATIYKENKKLEQQVERVLQMARMDSGALQLDREVVFFHSIVEEVAHNFKLNQVYSTIKIETDCSAADDLVAVDTSHLTNVLVNLLDNAKKYSEKNPEIKVSTQNKNKGLIVKVKDNGIGIEGKDQTHIFEQFYRVPTGNKHDVKGFGLGLYYVKSMIEKHRGKIAVHSKPGKGTTFTFWLPLANKENETKNTIS